MGFNAVEQRSLRARHRHGARPAPIWSGYTCVMEDQAPRHADTAVPPDGRNREVDAARKDVREVVKGKGRLVRKHAFPPRPEPQFGEFLVLGSGVMDDSVDSAPHSPHAAVLDVAAQELPVEARRTGLLGREEAGLASSHDEELVPARPFPLDRHSINVNVTLSFVQARISNRAPPATSPRLRLEDKALAGNDGREELAELRDGRNGAAPLVAAKTIASNRGIPIVMAASFSPVQGLRQPGWRPWTTTPAFAPAAAEISRNFVIVFTLRDGRHYAGVQGPCDDHAVTYRACGPGNAARLPSRSLGGHHAGAHRDLAGT